MDVSNHSSSPTRPSPVSKISASDAEDTNENNQNNQHMGSNSKNQKKPTKNFMSPTISAASKAVVPRKKILTERNESSESISSDTHVHKTPDFDSNPSSANLGTGVNDCMSPIMTSFSGVLRFDDEEQKTIVSNSSSQPYDPVTNYLTPRPKFLRYKPSRRREVFLRHDYESNEIEDGTNADKSGSVDSKNFVEEEMSLRVSSSSSSQEDSVKQEDEEIEESDEEFEEVEEERGWNLKGVMKTLFVFVVLVVSTLYISSMNSPTPPPDLQALWKTKNEPWKIQNPLFGTGSVNCSENGNEESLDQYGETEVDLVDISQRHIDEWVEAEDMGVDETSDELGEMLEPNGGGSEVVEMAGGEKEGSGLELQAGDIEDESFDKEERNWEVSDLMAESDEVQDRDAPEKIESLLKYHAPDMSDWVDHQDSVWALVTASEKEDMEKSRVTVEEVSKEGYQNEEVAGEVIMSEMMGNEESTSNLINLDKEVNSMDGVVELSETGLMAKFAIGISAFFAVVASLLMGFHFKHKTTLDRGPSSPGDNPCSDPVVAEKNSSVVASKGQEHIEKNYSFATPSSEIAEKNSSVVAYEEQEHIEKKYSFATPSSLIHSMEEGSKEFNQKRAPTVELLGEFEVGELSTSSLRSCRKKSRIMESDLSNYSITQENYSWSKGQSVPIQRLSEFSSMDSPSYGSFTAETKITRKEEGRDGEVKKVISTPVRRSSRIHKRAVVSP